jgi:hypothetical protein
MEEMKSVLIEWLKERAEEETTQLKLIYLEESQKPSQAPDFGQRDFDC